MKNQAARIEMSRDEVGLCLQAAQRAAEFEASIYDADRILSGDPTPEEARKENAQRAEIRKFRLLGYRLKRLLALKRSGSR